jgi:hypothetical protein
MARVIASLLRHSTSTGSGIDGKAASNIYLSGFLSLFLYMLQCPGVVRDLVTVLISEQNLQTRFSTTMHRERDIKWRNYRPLEGFSRLLPQHALRL